MKPFEYYFPSFSKHPRAISHEYSFSANDIKRLCLDKQRVREAWKIQRETFDYTQEEENAFFKELGL